jgi:hypothetical protein
MALHTRQTNNNNNNNNNNNMPPRSRPAKLSSPITETTLNKHWYPYVEGEAVMSEIRRGKLFEQRCEWL